MNIWSCFFELVVRYYNMVDGEGGSCSPHTRQEVKIGNGGKHLNIPFKDVLPVA